MITEREVRVWADEQGLANLALAEQDCRLVRTLETIYADAFLAPRLGIKGGTALNKLYLKRTPRLSVDLDFNHLGSKQEVLRERREICERLTKLLQAQDPSYNVGCKRRYEQTTLTVKYRAVTGVRAHLKVEVSHVERFPILEGLTLRLEAPDTSFKVTSYKLEELVATKLRALFERLKGRDVYDLYYAAQLRQDWVAVRKLFLYYFYRSRKVFNPKVYFKNISEKYQAGRYVDDVSAFIRPDSSFVLSKAIDKILIHYSFLGGLDERDQRFLALARYLLGGQVAHAALPAVQRIKLPLKDLFGTKKISDEAASITISDIKPYSKRKKPPRTPTRKI